MIHMFQMEMGQSHFSGVFTFAEWSVFTRRSYLASLLGHGINLIGIPRTKNGRYDCSQNTLFTKVERKIP